MTEQTKEKGSLEITAEKTHEKSRNHRRRKNPTGGERTVTIILALFVVSVICLLITIVLFFIHRRDVKRIATLTNSVNILTAENKDMKDKIPTGEYIYTNDIKDKARQYGATLNFLQKLFPENIVYIGSGGVTFGEIDKSLPKSFINPRYIEEEEDGTYTYLDEENNIQGIKGMDVSSYQQNINWQAAKNDGVDFAMIRYGYRGYSNGKIVEDNYFRQNIKGALNAGINVGVYFFSQAINEEEAVEEAQALLEAIEDFDVKYPIAFDMEEVADDEYRTKDLSREQRTNIALAFCREIEKSGYKPMIYGNMKWLIENYDTSRIIDYDLWLAYYSKNLSFPYKTAMWQYTGSGDVNGVAGGADLNLCFHDYAKEK